MIDYTRDDARRRLTFVGSGEFHTDEILELFTRMRTDGTWPYALLYDLRQVTGVPPVSELRRFAQAAAQTNPAAGPRGPLALVATDPAIYGLACAYAAMQQGRQVEVFRERAEAEAWLDGL